MSRSPVAAAFSCVAFVNVRLYVVPDARLIITGVAPTAVFAAMMAPRKLQSLAASVQAVAAAVSSVRSTTNVVVNGGTRLEILGTARAIVICWLDELDDALGVYFRDAPTTTTSVNSSQGICLFIVMLQHTCS